MTDELIKFAIWGVGLRGKKIFSIMDQDSIECFIDNDDQIVGQNYGGKTIFSYDDYRKRNKDTIIIVSLFHYKEVEQQLLENNDYNYVILKDSPHEVMEYNVCDLINYSGYKKHYGDRIVLCGITLLTYIIYNELLRSGIGACILSTDEKINNSKYRCCTMDDVFAHEKDTDFFIMQKKYLDLIPKISKTYNFYDFTYTIDTYYNKKIEKYKNLYTGKRCFIIATGPSLKIEDLETLYEKKEYCFSMNKIFMSFNQTQWRPDFYVADDALVIEQNATIIDQLEINHIFIGDRTPIEFNDNVLRYHLYWEKDIEDIFFSEDLPHMCAGGGTVTYSILQFAVYMGFKEIYLLGVDFNYFGRGAVGNHFYKEEDKKNNVICLDESLEAYKCAKKYADGHGIKIYNATRGGKLEVFERVDFDTLF